MAILLTRLFACIIDPLAQRAWTLQEYAVGKQLRVMTETCVSHGREHCIVCGQAAVVTGEEAFFDSFRRAQTLRMPACRPFWLLGVTSPSMGVTDASRIVEEFYEIQLRVHCHDPADKIRSLYPL